jgi:hypothetical protein
MTAAIATSNGYDTDNYQRAPDPSINWNSSQIFCFMDACSPPRSQGK